MKVLVRAKSILAKNSYIDYFIKLVVVNLSQLVFGLKYGNKSVDKNKFIFECFQGKNVSDSPWAIYLELCKSSEDYKFIWVLDKKNEALEELLSKNKKTEIVYYGTEEYDCAYATSGFWITNCRLPFRLKKKASQKYIQCWHGTPLKKLGLDIENGTYKTTSKLGMRYSYKVDSKRYDYFISPSRYASECFSSAFDIPNDKLIELGYPRNDFLISECNNIKKINEIKSSLGIGKNKKVVLYAPTWRDMQFCHNRQGYYFNNPLDNDSFYNKFSDDIVFLFRGHYFSESTEKHTRFLNVSSYNNVNDLYLISDVLITDYSSVFFDYALLSRPILFFMYDREHYENENRGFYIDVDKELPGAMFEDSETLVKGIKLAPLEVSHKAFNCKFNPFEDGDSAKRVIDIFMVDNND